MTGRGRRFSLETDQSNVTLPTGVRRGFGTHFLSSRDTVPRKMDFLAVGSHLLVSGSDVAAVLRVFACLYIGDDRVGMSIAKQARGPAFVGLANATLLTCNRALQRGRKASGMVTDKGRRGLVVGCGQIGHSSA